MWVVEYQKDGVWHRSSAKYDSQYSANLVALLTGKHFEVRVLDEDLARIVGDGSEND